MFGDSRLQQDILAQIAVDLDRLSEDASEMAAFGGRRRYKVNEDLGCDGEDCLWAIMNVLHLAAALSTNKDFCWDPAYDKV